MEFTICQIASVVGRTGRTWLRGISSDLRQVKEDAESLSRHLHDINESVKQGKEENRQEVTKVAQDWLDEVTKLLEEDQVQKIINYVDDQSGTSIIGRGINKSRYNNPYSRLKWSKIALRKHQQFQKLIHSVPVVVTRSPSGAEAHHKIAEFMSLSLNSRDVIMEKIVDKLLQDQVHVVGLFGNALTGKSKIAKDTMKSKRVQEVFGKRVALVEVSETSNTKDIQDKIRAFVLDQTIQSHHDRKILIILDHVFWELNLKSLGIDDPAKNFKVLVVSREKNMCREMGAEEDDVLEIKPLELDEARHLFWTHVFPDIDTMVNQVTSWNYVSKGDKLVKDYSRCLPLVVTTLAKAVKHQNLDQWESFAKELPTKKDEVLRFIWNNNIRNLNENKEKKSFFLLACLSPHELSIPIEELMRYAMGLDLIQWVNNLSEAITQANTWADELISSSLLEADGTYNVSIHHLVREHAITALPENEKQKYLVRAIPRWHTEETCKGYTGISLMPGSDHSRLHGLNSDKLQLLLLNRSEPLSQLSHDFFKWMVNIKVLVLKGMTMQPHVPSSINQLLENSGLRLLSLEECKLGTFEPIDAKKVNLVVLSFHKSEMETLPVELLKKCHILRLLDLSECNISKEGIPADVLKELSQLEGLYASDSFDDWAFENHELDSATRKSDSYESYASISELNCLNHLNVLKINLRQLQQWPIQGEHIVENLKQFHICVGSQDQATSTEESCCRRILQLQSVDASSITSEGWLKELLKKCEMLKVQRLEKLQQFIPDDNRFKFPNLQNLQITGCSQMQCFSPTPFKAQCLDTLIVSSCDSLKYFFEEPNDHMEFPTLKQMRLCNLQNLQMVLAKSNRSTTSNDLQGEEHQDQAFFHKKILFPLLKKLEMEDLGQVVKLWDVKCKDLDDKDSFKNLKYIRITRCDKLESLGSLSTAGTLERLKELTITDCPNLKEVIRKERTEDEEVVYHIFPSLKKISLKNCPSLLVFLSGIQNNVRLELQRLQMLEIANCSAEMMTSLSSGVLKMPNLDINNIDSSLLKCLQTQIKPSSEQILGCWSCWNVPCVMPACFDEVCGEILDKEVKK